MATSGLNPEGALARLLAAPVRPGEVVWIGVRPARRAPMLAVREVLAEPDKGLAGDRYAGRPGAARQVTLIEAEDLAAIASYLGRAEVAPELLRRNLVIRGLNLQALKGHRLRVGGAVLEPSGPCHPCSRLEENLGIGGYNAARAHGGITARVIAPGEIRLGEAAVRLDPPAWSHAAESAV